MRISTAQIFNQGIQQFQNITSQQARTQEQLGTGKEILKPSDDPVASTRILSVKDDLAQSEQFLETIGQTRTRLEREDTALSSFTDALARARELMVQAGNGALTQDDRQTVAAELRQVKDQMVNIANTQGPSGEHVFAGFQGAEKPFVENVSGDIVYRGDEGQRSVQIDDSVTLDVNDNGKETFVSIPSDRPTFQTRPAASNQSDPPARISTGVVSDRETFEDFAPDDLVVEFREQSSGNTVFDVKARNTGRELATDVDFVSGEPIEFQGMQFEISGEPEDGDAFFVETGNQQSVFATMEKMIEGLETLPNTPSGREGLKDTIDQGLANLDNAESRVTEIQAGVGSRLNTLESTEQFLKDSDLLSQETLSNLEDLDFAEAISRFNQQNTTLQAAQQSFARITSLSLFDAI